MSFRSRHKRQLRRSLPDVVVEPLGDPLDVSADARRHDARQADRRRGIHVRELGAHRTPHHRITTARLVRPARERDDPRQGDREEDAQEDQVGSRVSGHQVTLIVAAAGCCRAADRPLRHLAASRGAT